MKTFNYMYYALIIFLAKLYCLSWLCFLSFFISLNSWQVFKNHGASAGASMAHSHSQIVGLPVVPPSVSARLNCTKEFFDRTGKCSLCDIRSKEILIDETRHFFSIAPFAASYPFEIWIVPREHISYFHELDHKKVAFFLLFFLYMHMKLIYTSC